MASREGRARALTGDAAVASGAGAGAARGRVQAHACPTHPERTKLATYCMTFSDRLFSSGVNRPS